MSTPLRICAFYSRGPHYQRLLKKLRVEHPDAVIHAVVPPTFPAEVLHEVVDEVIQTEQAQWSLRELGALGRLLSVLRGARYDLFVVMFDSPKLRILAALSGARKRQLFTIDGRMVPLRLALVRQSLGALGRNVRGRLLYAYLHYVVYTKPVQKA